MQVVSYPSLTWPARHCSRPSCWRAPSPCPGWSSQCPSSRTRPTPLWTILEWNGPELSIFKLELYLELVTDLFISLKSMLPLPSTSYILKAQPSFSSGEPLDVVWRASMNSLQIYQHAYQGSFQTSQSRHPANISLDILQILRSREFPHLKSMVPLLLVSNVLKMLLLKLSALPLGKILEYISTNWSLVSSPLGQSARNPSYHSCTHKCQVSGVKCVKYARNRCRASFKCQVSSLRCQMSSVKCQMLSVKKCQEV